ncbi:MAG: Rne/Rng family ribonuclease [Desulfuromonadales bacterium]|nr:Rne/Rng family ribonuclease [Desulfuromonadales bacterium]
MSKKMLINATHPEENRVAIVEDGILTELDIEIAGKEQTKGNIYKAVVVRVEPGLQAAFIDYGGERLGFLQMGEIHPLYLRDGDTDTDMRGRRITDVLRRGQELLVQVVKEERGTKGAALTTFLSLPGRYMVLMPDSDTKGVSRKIEDDSQRRKLKEAMTSLDLPSTFGYIVRTAGIGQKKEELKRDFNYLVRVWEKIQEQARQARAPSLIYKESNLVIRSLRDYFSSDMDEVLVDDIRVCQEAKDFFQEVMPEYAKLVKLHQEKRPIFSRYQIEEQIETISKNKVPLPSGGSIVIDATEALVAVDVNSGKMAGETNVESTAYKSNLEAAAETARQLRLRDLGGLIVIDFIDMRDRKHIREVEKCLKDSLKYDKARVTVGRISQFGLLEMSRQRIKATLAEGSFLSCPHCFGSGKVKSFEAQAVSFLRKLHGAIAKGQIGRVEGEVPLEVATYLLNSKREELLDMERLHQVVIVIKGRPDLLPSQMELVSMRREKEESQLADVIPFLPAVQPPPPMPRPALAEEPAMAEPAAPPTEELEPALGEAESEAGRKKRKRKRKKKKPEELLAASEGATAEAAGSEEEAPAEATSSPDLGSESPEEEAAGPADTEAGGEVRDERKKRRRRRRKKKTPGQEAAATEAGQEGEPPAETPEMAHETAAGEAGEAPEKEGKSRRRRRKKRPEAPLGTMVATAAEAGANDSAATEESPSPEPAVAAVSGEVDANPSTEPARQAEESRPKRARPPRRPAARPEEAARPDESPTVATGTPVVDPSGPEAPLPAAAITVPKRPSRQRTKKAAAEEPVVEMTQPAKQEAAAAAGPEPEEKPKRRPPRKKAATTTKPPAEETPAE